MGIFLRRGYVQRVSPASDLGIGQTIKLNVGGKAWDWLVIHQGLPSDIYDASCNGTWLLMKDIYEKQKWYGTYDSYEYSAPQSYLNGDFLNLFDGNVKGAIKQVQIPYRKGGSGGTNQSGENGLICKIFLLSGYEVGFTKKDNSYFPLDGAKLSYFEAGTGTSANNKRIAKLNGSAAGWWLRSQYIDGNGRAWSVRTNGSNEIYSTGNPLGIRPALILQSDFNITDDMLAA